MNSLRSDGISIYPNPFTSETTIAFDQEQIQATITVIDALGKNIRNEQFSGKQFTFRKDDISSGVYFLRIENKLNQILYKKMIVQ
jgi:hypothetical protein